MPPSRLLHGPGIRIGERELLIRAGEPLRLQRLEPLHLLLQGGDLLLQVALLELGRLGLGAVGGVHRPQVTLDALFDLCHAPLHLGAGEVLVAVVDRLELGSIDGHDGLREQLQFAAQNDELATHAADRRSIVLTEVGNGLEVRPQAAGEPHQLDVALGLTLQAAARLDAIEVTVDVDLQQHRGVVGWSAGCRRIDGLKTQRAKIECFDERLDDSHGIVLGDEVLDAFWKQYRLCSTLTLDKALHSA
jgi:hypothetical protein